MNCLCMSGICVDPPLLLYRNKGMVCFGNVYGYCPLLERSVFGVTPGGWDGVPLEGRSECVHTALCRRGVVCFRDLIQWLSVFPDRALGEGSLCCQPPHPRGGCISAPSPPQAYSLSHPPFISGDPAYSPSLFTTLPNVSFIQFPHLSPPPLPGQI